MKELTNVQRLFFELLQVAIGTREQLSQMPSENEWDLLNEESDKQGLVGIAYVGVKKMVKQSGCSLPRKILLRWNGGAVQMQDQNANISPKVERVLKYFREANFQAIILKGQSHLSNYPEELRELRMPGDIDVWVKGKNKKDVYDFVRKDCPEEKYGYLHIDFPAYSDIPVEVHIRPVFLCNPFRNRRLQQWVDSIDLCSLGELDNFRAFNAIYQPLHLFKHLSRVGIFLRQLLDYYFLLKHMPNTDFDMLRSLGIDKFTNDLQAVVLHLFEDVPISTMSGERLLEEVMIDIDADINLGNDDWTRFKRVVWMYPSEFLWRPYFWLFQKIWMVFF